ncbi:MAG: hypothetical protein CL932_07775 [Deltaproteobacteria bacterium]|nr:hypothetical protein [Deltaproteobacteria bacterium]
MQQIQIINFQVGMMNQLHKDCNYFPTTLHESISIPSIGKNSLRRPFFARIQKIFICGATQSSAHTWKEVFAL